MTIAISSILSRASTLLLDETAVRWPQAELLIHLNDGVLEMASMKPLLFLERATMDLSAGVYQSIPAGKRHLHRVISNASGPVVRIVDQQVLDSQEPSWYVNTAVANVKYVVLEKLNAKNFLCYPPNDGTGQLDAIFTIEPSIYAADGSIDIDSTYGNPLLAFILYRAFLKDADTSNDAKANTYYETFARQMGGSVLGEAQAKEL
tara:strand:- start:2885 stop:3499 length:615 start_codon:yes stop_codon:yes gene_type:complete